MAPMGWHLVTLPDSSREGGGSTSPGCSRRAIRLGPECWEMAVENSITRDLAGRTLHSRGEALPAGLVSSSQESGSGDREAVRCTRDRSKQKAQCSEEGHWLRTWPGLAPRSCELERKTFPASALPASPEFPSLEASTLEPTCFLQHRRLYLEGTWPL